MRGKQVKIKKCQTCLDKSSKFNNGNEMGHRPRNCKKSSVDAREGESDGSESELEEESTTSKRSQKKKSHSTSFLRRSEDKAYGRDLRRSNNAMRRVKGEKDRNIIVSNLERSGHEFVERRPEKQPRVKASMSVMTLGRRQTQLECPY